MEMRHYQVKVSKRPVVKAKPAQPPTTAPMMKSLGLIDLLDPASFSKDETTTGSSHAIDGIDVVTALVPEEDVWQIEDTITRTREIQFQDGEQEAAAIVDREDSHVPNPKTVNVCEARTGEKLNSEDMRKRKAKEVQEFDEFEVKMEVVKSEIRMTPGKKVHMVKHVWKHERIQTSLGTSCLVSSLEKAVLSRSQGPKCTKKCGWSSGYFEPHPRQSSLQRVHLASATFADLKAWRNRDTISFYVVPPQGPPQETKDLEFAQ